MTQIPEGISEQAWDEARAVVADTQGCNCSHCVGTIARAIMAATERAALIAQNWQPPKQDITEPTKLYRPFEVADAIAAAIRQGAQPSNAIPVTGTVK